MYEVIIETWVPDAETADWVAGEAWWLEGQFEDAKRIAQANGKTISLLGLVILDSHTFTGNASDGGLFYDFKYLVPVLL